MESTHAQPRIAHSSQHKPRNMARLAKVYFPCQLRAPQLLTCFFHQFFALLTASVLLQTWAPIR